MEQRVGRTGICQIAAKFGTVRFFAGKKPVAVFFNYIVIIGPGDDSA